MIRKVPWSFFSALGLAAVFILIAVWWFVNYLYSFSLENKDALVGLTAGQYEIVKDRLDDLQRLHDSDKQRIADLENQVSRLRHPMISEPDTR